MPESNGKPVLDRSVLPIPDRPFTGVAKRTLAGSVPDFPSAGTGARRERRTFCSSSSMTPGSETRQTFGGPSASPTLERLAQEGLRYNRFHVTALCSPSRAALLSGRNHHAVGFGSVAEFCGGWPGLRRDVASERRVDCGNLAQQRLQHSGLREMASRRPTISKDRPGRSTAGRMDSASTISGASSAARRANTTPCITENNTVLGPPEDETFYFPDAMADKAIGWIRGQKSQAPENPFFIYFSTGASHAPHHVGEQHGPISIKGKFDAGWDALRVQTFERQKKLGVIPADAQLTPRNEAMPAWDSLSAAEKKLYARQMEVYAGYQENADHNIGRVIRRDRRNGHPRRHVGHLYLRRQRLEHGRHDNRLLQRDDRAERRSADVPNSSCRSPTPTAVPPPGVAAGSAPHFSCAWAWAGNTPFQWGKQVASHFGGTRDPMVIRYPKRITDKGGIRSQFTHVNDVAPTILEIAERSGADGP